MTGQGSAKCIDWELPDEEDGAEESEEHQEGGDGGEQGAHLWGALSFQLSLLGSRPGGYLAPEADPRWLLAKDLSWLCRWPGSIMLGVTRSVKGGEPTCPSPPAGPGRGG